MAVNIGPKIGIEGEAEYRRQINQIIQTSKTLATQMKALTTSYDTNNKSLKQNAEQYKLLSQQITNQKSKVEAMKGMLQKATQVYEENKRQLDLHKTALTEDSAEIARLEKAVADSGNVMERWKQNVNSATAELNQMENELKGMPTSLDLVANKVAELGSKLEGLGQTISNIGSKMTRYITTPIITGFTAAIKTTADFDSQMSKVQAISGANAEQFERLKQGAREMGEQTKFSATEAGEAYEYMAMAGWKTEQMLEGLPGILNLAAASNEELGTTSDIVTDALTAFHMEAEDASHFADVLASAASNANTNVSMMGESFKYVAPVAGAMGYTIEDIAIALGLMANSGIKADMAGTSLRNMIQRMAKPTKESQAAMDRLGLALADDEGKMYSFREIMDQLRESFSEINMSAEDYDFQLGLLEESLANGSLTQKKYNAALEELNKQAFGAEGAEKARAAAMLGGTRALSGLLAIAEASEDEYKQLADAIDSSSDAFAKLADGSVVPLNKALEDGSEVIKTYNGMAEAMADIMQDNLGGDITILKSKMQELAISIGNLLMPKLREIVAQAQAFIDKLNALSNEEKLQIVKMAGIAAALGPVLMIGGKLLAVVGKIMTFAPQIATAIQGISGAFGGVATTAAGALLPIAAVIAIIGTLVAAFATLWNNNEQFRESMTGTWEHIKESFGNFIAQVQERLPALQEAFSNFIEKVKPLWEAFCNILGPWFEAAFQLVSVTLDALFNAIISVIDMLTAILNGDKELFMQGLQNFLLTIWTLIQQTWAIWWEWITSTIDVLLSFFGTSLDEVSTIFEELLTTLWDLITEKVTELVDFVTEKIEGVCDFIASLPERFYQWGVEMIENLAQGIMDTIDLVGGAIEGVANKIAEFIHFSEPDRGPLSQFNKWMPDMMKQMAEQIEAGRFQVKVAAAHVAADIAAPMAGARTVTLNNSFNFGGGYSEADGRSIVRQINRQLGALYI